MKQNSLGTKILMALVTLGVVGYFAIQAAQYLSDPLTTAIAYAYEVEEGVDLSGYVVRREQVLADDANGSLRLRRAEGERVSAGGVVAAVYADQAALDRQSQIEQLQDQVEQLRYAQEAALGSEASLKLDVQIVQHLLDYRQDLAAERLYDAEKAGDELRALVLKRDYTHSDTEDIAAENPDAARTAEDLAVPVGKLHPHGAGPGIGPLFRRGGRIRGGADAGAAAGADALPAGRGAAG